MFFRFSTLSGFPLAQTAGWSTFPSQRRRMSLLLPHNSSEKVNLLPLGSYCRSIGLWAELLRDGINGMLWSLTSVLWLCRWPLGIRQCPAGAELSGLERDSARVVWSCYIWGGVYRTQKPGTCKNIVKLWENKHFSWTKICLCFSKVCFKVICGFVLVFQSVTMAGDGYRGRMSPHTPNEKFEGATVLKTLQVHWQWSINNSLSSTTWLHLKFCPNCFQSYNNLIAKHVVCSNSCRFELDLSCCSFKCFL